jgi:hypothetical protein
MIPIAVSRRAPSGLAMRPCPDQPERRQAMAKGQMRSNKEVKKPKKDKAKPAVAVASTSASRIQGSQDKAKGDK